MAEISRDYLRSILDYDPETGVFTWKARPVRAETARTDNAWNSRRVGSEAGTINRGGYRTINLFGIPRYAHRLAFVYMLGEAPEFVDHIDRDRSNNRWANLRSATLTQNLANSKIRSDNTSGRRGVSWYPAYGKWSVRLYCENQNRFLGYYDTLDEAAAAYEAAAREAFGPYWNCEGAGGVV